MAKILVNHMIVVPDPNAAGGAAGATARFYFKAPPDGYEGLADETGVTTPATPGKYDGAPACSVEQLLLSGVATRKTIVVQNGTKESRHQLIISRDKADSFNTAAIGKTYKGRKILRVTNNLKAKSR
jgi:hypothetical protein